VLDQLPLGVIGPGFIVVGGGGSRVDGPDRSPLPIVIGLGPFAGVHTAGGEFDFLGISALDTLQGFHAIFVAHGKGGRAGDLLESAIPKILLDALPRVRLGDRAFVDVAGKDFRDGRLSVERIGEGFL